MQCQPSLLEPSDIDEILDTPFDEIEIDQNKFKVIIDYLNNILFEREYISAPLNEESDLNNLISSSNSNSKSNSTKISKSFKILSDTSEDIHVNHVRLIKWVLNEDLNIKKRRFELKTILRNDSENYKSHLYCMLFSFFSSSFSNKIYSIEIENINLLSKELYSDCFYESLEKNVYDILEKFRAWNSYLNVDRLEKIFADKDKFIKLAEIGIGEVNI
jgi:hypothetical protein